MTDGHIFFLVFSSKICVVKLNQNFYEKQNHCKILMDVNIKHRIWFQVF